MKNAKLDTDGHLHNEQYDSRELSDTELDQVHGGGSALTDGLTAVASVLTNQLAAAAKTTTPTAVLPKSGAKPSGLLGAFTGALNQIAGAVGKK